MPNASARPEQSSTPDYNAPYLHGTLTSDYWSNDDDPAFFRVSRFSCRHRPRRGSRPP